MILADISAWIQHLREGDAALVTFLNEQRVRTCDVVIGELLLGTVLPAGFARDLRMLPRLASPSPAQTLTFVERHSCSFAGAGVGWSDAQILLTAAKAGARLHTANRALRRLCRSLDVKLA